MRPLPRLDEENRTFWTAGADGVLRLMQCCDCHRYFHPPRDVCRHCLSDNVTWSPVSGTAVVDTFTVNHQQWFPGQDVPYVIARVALDDAPGVYLTTNIVACDPDTVAIGDQVRVCFEQHGEVFLPLFEKVGRP